MIATTPLHVHTIWHTDQRCFFVTAKSANSRVSSLDLKLILFTWHSASYYGTFIETASIRGTDGVLLPALLALDYFAEPCPNAHADIHWDDETELLLQAAPSIRAAINDGRVRPDFAKWKSGSIGWKLAGIELPRTIPYMNEWLQQVMEDKMRNRGTRHRAWDFLVRSLDNPTDDSLPADFWTDEEDWLSFIGWKSPDLPFAAALRLSEPENGASWTLQIIVLDRTDNATMIVCDGLRLPPLDDLPVPWQPHAAQIEEQIEKDVRKWTYIVPWLQDGGQRDRIRTSLNHEEAWLFLTESSLQLADFGYTIFLPSWWEQIRKVKPKLKAKIKSSVGSPRQSMFGLDQIVQFDWKLALGDVELSEEQFKQLVEEKRRLIQINGKWVQLDPAMLQQVQEALKRGNKQGLSFRDVLEMHLLGAAPIGELQEDSETDDVKQLQMEVELNGHLASMIGQLQHSSSIELISPPASFHGVLRKYQVEGASWLLFLRRFGLGACLADDMGLGKTIQWITYLLYMKETEQRDIPSLLICPTSVLGNWQKELERFAPSLKAHLHYGPARSKGDDFQAMLTGYDLVITSYALSHLDEAELSSVHWNCICLDEAQNIKNSYTKQATSIRRLTADHYIAMTGTPIENRLTELWSIYDFINPGYLGSPRAFSHRFVNEIEKTNDRKLVAQVQRLVQPFLLRRVKNDPAIELDLPDKIESKEYISLTVEQGALYENALHDLFERLDKLSAMERRGQILATLTRLKQICDHPALFLKEGAHASGNNRSNKIVRLLEMIDDLRSEGDCCLIFTQFVEMGHLLCRVLEQERNEKVQFLHGGTPKAQRDKMIAHFQDVSLPAEQRSGIFVLSLKAGGIGLNLTAANHVFHVDRWWNPAVENQATDRAFRIGQTKHVQVHKFITLGTLEERIDEMIERKQGLSRQIVGAGENWITELSTDELKQLFSLRREWVDSYTK